MIRFAWTLLSWVSVAVSVLAQTDAAPTPSPVRHSWIRMSGDPASKSTLEIALRKFERADGVSVTLVGVAHVGEKSFYEALQQKLNTFDVVLYESVLPDGASRPEGSTEAECADATLRSLVFLADTAKRQREATGAWPTNLNDLATWAGKSDPRLGHGVRNASADAWGTAVTWDATDAASPFIVQAPGRDGRATLSHTVDLPASQPTSRRSKKPASNVQQDLAHALGLAYQLEAIDYRSPNFVHADASMGDVSRGMKAAGGNSTQLESLLRGGGPMGSLLQLMITLIKTSSDENKGMIRGILVEVLASADDRMVDMLGKGTSDVIVGMRNRVAFRELDRLLAQSRPPRSIAVFYGALHLDDMAVKLAERAFVAKDAEWLTAITAEAPAGGNDMLRKQLLGGLKRTREKQRDAASRPTSQPSK